MSSFAFRSYGEMVGAPASATGITINAAASIAAGDLLLTALYVENASNTWGTVPAGWSSVGNIINTGAFRLELFMKIATGGEPSTYAWSQTTAPQWRSGCMAAYSGGTGAVARAFSGSQADSQTEANQTAPSVSYLDTDLVIFIYANFSDVPNTGLNGYVNNQRGIGGSPDGSVIIADRIASGASTTGTTNPTGQGTRTYAAAHAVFYTPSGSLLVPRTNAAAYGAFL